jgi:ATP-dependent helicase/nuclease subunit A
VGIEQILAGLDSRQRAAVQSETNAVVSAGAGSGKTRVIASRYAWLVMEKGIPVEEIITLTFTNKAVNEMYRRIYGLLAAQKDDPRARAAVDNFNRANILTLDSFCTGIARLAARRYGISPDFVCDPEGVRDLAAESALSFVLDHRDNRGLRALMGDKKIQVLAEELFAESVLSAAPIAAPADFTALWEKQRDEILRAWNRQAKDAAGPVRAMLSVMGELEMPGDQTGTLLRQGAAFPPVPEIRGLLAGDAAGGGARSQVRDFFAFLDQFCAVSFSGRLNAAKEIIKENRDALRELNGKLQSLALFALSAPEIREVFALLEAYHRDFNRKKREAGILTFSDIAHLAVDALSRYPDLRQFYNRSFSAIMIDEFQDNNRLQRDLIFLLAEKADCEEPGIPDLSRLNPNKMIFVGDEKQSIYRFRGADVSVFRSLSGSFAKNYAGGHIRLEYNYRSRPALIRAFNYFFGGLLPGGGGPGEPVFLRDSKELPDYEARYEGIASGLDPGEPAPDDFKNPPLHFCFLDQGQVRRDDPGELSAEDLEAAFIAMKIRELTGGEEIRLKGGVRQCGYGDIAVLLRTTGHQLSLEKQFQNFGIPYNTDDPAGLFSDAPINDLFSFLRLLAYPQDRAAYAALIRSPFCGLSDLTLTVCMLDPGGVPFDEKLEKDIPGEERGAFRKSRELYQSLAEAARTKTTAELLTRLWYEAGYRYETLWSPPAQIYGELFDFFFELARLPDQKGQSLPEFLDSFSLIIKNDERIRELRVPVEREGGVRIMTVHKSKGLEFPVVFIPACQGKARIDGGGKTFFFSEDWGISLKLPAAEELPGTKTDNYFYLLHQEEEKQKAAAELRRLLYVAMTRAESRLFLSAVLPPAGNKEEPETHEGGPFWPERLAELKAKREDREALPGFLDLLLPALITEDRSLFCFETIPVYRRAELSRFYAAGRRARQAPMIETAEAAAGFYEKTPAVSPPRPPAPVLNASALRYMPPAAASAERPPAETAPGGIEELLRQAELEPAEFGTLVHAYLEALTAGKKPRIPFRFLARLEEKDQAELDRTARDMAEKFLASELGRLSLSDPRREAEFPILTLVETGGAKIPVNGVIDLLFETEGVMQIVDFKTDKTEDPERHLAQMAVYRRAVSDIFGRPVRAWLYYLRSGKAVELTADLEKVNIEEAAARCIAGD